MKVMLDSGAYTVWKQGSDISLGAYVDFVKRNEPLLDCYFNLDVIPGTNGRREWRSSSIEAAAARSYENQQRMKGEGLRPIPVFHQDEGMCWLERYVSDGEAYIALSPYKRHDPASATRWLDRCFDLLASTGGPLVKTHAMGLTAPDALLRYPWASADSSRWALAAGFGQIPVPIEIDGNWNYGVYDVVPMTGRSAHDRRHIDARSGLDLERVRQFLAEVGVELAEARYNPTHRHRTWIVYFMRLAQMCSERQGWASLRHPAHEMRPADWTFEIAFVTDTTRQQRSTLVECGASLCLLSFAKLMEQPNDALARYARGDLEVPRQRSRTAKPKFRSELYWERRALALYRRICEYENLKTIHTPLPT